MKDQSNRDVRAQDSILFRVLFANLTANVGGSEQVVISLAERLPAYGIGVSFALFRPGPLEDILRRRGIKVHVFPKEYRFRNLGSVLRCGEWLAGCIREDRANLLHSNLAAHFVGGWSSRRTKVPELWHLHDYPFKFDIVHAINRLIPANFYLFTTNFIRSGEPFLANRRSAVINPNCIDVEKLRTASEQSSIRERLSIRAGGYFLTVARLQEHKGHAYLIDAAAQVVRAHPGIKFVIAGSAIGTEQENYLSMLQRQIADRGLEGSVLLPGFIEDDDMASLFRGAIALVHPAVTEGYGLVILEAMANGVPVIAAAASGPAEIIQDEVNGLLVPTRDAGALASAMNRVIENPTLATRLSMHAEQDVRQKSVEVMVEETVAVYRGMLGAN